MGIQLSLIKAIVLMNIDFILKNYQRYIKPITVVVQGNILVLMQSLEMMAIFIQDFADIKSLKI